MDVSLLIWPYTRTAFLLSWIRTRCWIIYIPLKQKEHHRPPSFEFTVYSMRYACKMRGLSYLQFSLPEIQRPEKLPVVLSQQEVRLLLKSCTLLKHSILLATIYGCGLRCAEVRQLGYCRCGSWTRYAACEKWQGRQRSLCTLRRYAYPWYQKIPGCGTSCPLAF